MVTHSNHAPSTSNFLTLTSWYINFEPFFITSVYIEIYMMNIKYKIGERASFSLIIYRIFVPSISFVTYFNGVDFWETKGEEDRKSHTSQLSDHPPLKYVPWSSL